MKAGKVRQGPLLLALLASVASTSCGAGGDEPRLVPVEPKRPTTVTIWMPTASTAGSQSGHPVRVELALTRAERDRGLMHRTSLETDAGMLFLFPDEAPRTFWMRNTLIPLDILFLDSDGTIQNIARGQPGVERPGYHSLRPARMVLELSAGWCAEHGIQAGQQVEIPADVLELPAE
jgi:uncharacterized membrane protein (UPF0127 family)